LDASIHQHSELKVGCNWPSPWKLGSSILVAIAFFYYIYQPMHWVALGVVVDGVPPLILKAIAVLRKFVLDINILMLIAGEILCAC
jgi:Cd2+/Zn2+-exporting ATPase